MKTSARFGVGLSALLLVTVTACGGVAGPGNGYGAPGGSSAAADSGTGQLHTTGSSLGRILVNGAGMTIYFYDHDKPNESSSACTGPCISLWPAVTTSEANPTIAGVSGAVGTIAGANGTKQVTVNGLPLYTFAGDKNPGDTTGQGYQGIWWVVDSSGAKISSTTPAPSSPAYGGSAY